MRTKCIEALSPGTEAIARKSVIWSELVRLTFVGTANAELAARRTATMADFIVWMKRIEYFKTAKGSLEYGYDCL